MRYLSYILVFPILFSLSTADTFLKPTPVDYLEYRQEVHILVRIDNPVVNGRIAIGRNVNEALKNILVGPMQAYGDTLIAVAILRDGLETAKPEDRYWKGWIRLYLFNAQNGVLASVSVQVGEPPVTNIGIRLPAHNLSIMDKSATLARLRDIRGRNLTVTPNYFWSH